METMKQMIDRNARVQARYDELMREGEHGHYETMFRVVREETERMRSEYEPDAMMSMTWKKSRQVKEFNQGAEVVGLLMQMKDGKLALVKHGAVTWPKSATSEGSQG